MDDVFLFSFPQSCGQLPLKVEQFGLGVGLIEDEVDVFAAAVAGPHAVGVCAGVEKDYFVAF